MTAAPKEQRDREQRMAFPLDALPEWLGEYVVDVAASLQVGVNMPAAFALGALATAAAPKARIVARGDWEEQLNLFVALVAPPGARKSAVVSRFLGPLERHERELEQRMAGQLREQRLKRERLERELKDAKDGESWDDALRLEQELEETPPPTSPRLVADDVTAQKLGDLLCTHQCLGIISAEPSIFPTMLGRWANGSGQSELDVFLKGHAGDSIRVDRLNRPAQSVENPRLTMAIALQPDALNDISGTAGRGLLARFLWVTTPDLRGSRKAANARAIPASHQAAFERGMEQMLNLKPSPTPMRLSPGAEVLLVTFIDAIELRLHPASGDLGHFAGWGEKLCGLVVRLAGVLHLAEHPPTEQVSTETLRAAIAVGDWAIENAKVVFDAMSLDPRKRRQRAVMRVIREMGEPTVTLRDLNQRLKSRKDFATVDTLLPVVEELVAGGWLSRSPPSKRTGRPSNVFHVHEELLEAGFEGFETGFGGVQ